jgi:hypothetical protein
MESVAMFPCTIRNLYFKNTYILNSDCSSEVSVMRMLRFNHRGSVALVSGELAPEAPNGTFRWSA